MFLILNTTLFHEELTLKGEIWCWLLLTGVDYWLPRGGGGVLGLISTGYVPMVSQNPYPIIVYSVAKYGLHLSHFWENVILAISTWSLSVYASYLKNLLTRSSGNELIDTLVKLKEVKIFPFLYPYLPEFQIPQIPKIFYPILVTLIIMQPHYSQSSHENMWPHPAAHPHQPITRKYPSFRPGFSS